MEFWDFAWYVKKLYVEVAKKGRRISQQVVNVVLQRFRIQVNGTDEAQYAASGWFLRNEAGNQWIHNRLRTEFNIRKLEELPPARVPEALALLNDLGQSCDAITRLAAGMRDAFFRDVIGAGHPWTPWIARQLGGSHLIPSNPDWRAIGQALLQRKRLAVS